MAVIHRGRLKLLLVNSVMSQSSSLEEGFEMTTHTHTIISSSAMLLWWALLPNAANYVYNKDNI